MPKPVDCYALILAGGAGTRFWPASRVLRPKQLLPLLGGASLLRQTVERILPAVGGIERVLVASGRHLAQPTLAVLPELPVENLLLEPTPRNTAPCIGWATARLARKNPDAVVMVLPSDHHIEQPERFRETIAVAIESASSGTITAIGLRPTRAETGFGYIELASPARFGETQRAKRFVEKPNREKAEEYVASGRHLWNAGMFFFRAGDMLAAIRTHLPELAKGLDTLDRNAEHEAVVLDEVFRTVPSISIDHGVIERLDALAVVPGEFGWSDVGSWEAAWELARKDALGNSAPAGAVLVESENNLVVDLRTSATEPITLALVGAHDLVIVATDDALLIVPRDRAQDVRLAVDELVRRKSRLL